jgi:nucleotidyltransferase/DNA polymerase involved in DNA repair
VERSQSPRRRNGRALASLPREFPQGRRSSNYTRYGDMSARMVRVVSNFTSNLEIYSTNEAFRRFAGFEARCEPHARELRRAVQEWTRIPVSVGSRRPRRSPRSPIASRRRTPPRGGIRLLPGEQSQRDALGRLELTDLPNYDHSLRGWGSFSSFVPGSPPINQVFGRDPIEFYSAAPAGLTVPNYPC